MNSQSMIERAWLPEPRILALTLRRDWDGEDAPPVDLEPAGPQPAGGRLLSAFDYALESGYCFHKGRFYFVVDPGCHPWLDPEANPVCVAGAFSGWGDTVLTDRWRLEPREIEGRRLLVLEMEVDRAFLASEPPFKFVTRNREWLLLPEHAANRRLDPLGNENLYIDPARTGRHRFAYELVECPDLSQDNLAVLRREGERETAPVWPGEFFFETASPLPLGACIENGNTRFRVFAPRARKVWLLCFRNPDEAEAADPLPMERDKDGVWEAGRRGNLHGWYYWYRAEGPKNAFGSFDTDTRILDPYARAAVGRDGPGIVVDPARVRAPAERFRPPKREDLVIAETHVRDLVAHAPVAMTDDERKGFTGLRKWVRAKGFYLRRLGVNAVELQPVQEFDNAGPEDYHWGYMTVNYFAPESSYALKPAKASSIREFRALVEAFHEAGLAVLLDVVYNHVGEPAHVMFLDKLYYLEIHDDGELSNWSGVGNDLRTDAAMVRRLILDSLRWLVEKFDVDGFRFDLAELVGMDVLREIEEELNRLKPGIILIAEPWSFRGHIADRLRGSSYSYWNDGYRECLFAYVRGEASAGALRHFLKGSPGYWAAYPAQTVNYTQSHDDHAWIDRITENPERDGGEPTENDIARTHLMAAILFCSLGVPMIASGQDFLHSKRGETNTYLRPDLNALDYGRLKRHRKTHDYFREWIRFRLSDPGGLLRLPEHPPETYWAFGGAEDDSAFAVLINADGSRGPDRLLLAVNPGLSEVSVPLPAGAVGFRWIRAADRERFSTAGLPDSRGGRLSEDSVFLDPLQCGFWLAGAPGS